MTHSMHTVDLDSSCRYSQMSPATMHGQHVASKHKEGPPGWPQQSNK
eukprot:CAMPEP_0178436986 /NCGR_PEP_ID=MMETSP0689_2-20121128/34730_1 /TAXON_ID=160604 /ORGANISM="Amphidinium massartii, Strain CS-259" /LENGTH=46 /DNA_ID= /DNA_START= /DNA_END= /DNA_ORIENTATION=